ncbi:MAG TPA: hypothetical protein H9669_01635 [Firmicutes bacterium]|nr:hypothetical protein [Bacillota bacterium]
MRTITQTMRNYRCVSNQLREVGEESFLPQLPAARDLPNPIATLSADSV